jgi:hypothetical protein
MSYIDIVIYIRPLPILETWPPIYRGQERTVRDRLKASQVNTFVYFRYAPCLTDFTFKFIRRPIPPILCPSYWTFVELTLVSGSPRSSGFSMLQDFVSSWWWCSRSSATTSVPRIVMTAWWPWLMCSFIVVCFLFFCWQFVAYHLQSL